MDFRIDSNVITDIDLVVFDKDGTITDFYHYWAIMVQFRAAAICELLSLSKEEHLDSLIDAMGIDQKNFKIKSIGPVGLKSRIEVQKVCEKYLEGKVQDPLLSEKCFQAFKVADAHSNIKLNELIKCLDGVVDFIKELKRNNIKIAIATTDRTDRANLIMESIGIRNLFDYIIGFDQVVNPKPNPDQLLKINSELNIPVSSSIMIGDTYHDIEMSKRAEYKAAIAIKSDFIDEKMAETMTKYIINDFSQIVLEA